MCRMQTQVAEAIDQYRAVRRRVGFFDYSGRGKIVVEGPDRITFLQSMISNEVVALEEGTGNLASFLTARGKMVCLFYLYKLAEHILLDMEGGDIENSLSTFDKFVIMDDVRFQDATPDWGHLSLQGPETAGIVSELFSKPLPADLSMKEVESEGAQGWLIGMTRYATGCDLLFPPAVTARLAERLQELGVPSVHSEVEEMLRIESCRPRWGVDVDSDNNPLEARLDAAVSLSKGCYSGQEVISKATYVGGVGRLLMGLEIEAEETPPRGTAVLDEQSRRVGTVTSAAHSPALGRPIALAYLRKAVSRPGQQVALELSSTTRVPAHVVDRFIS